MYCSYYTYFIRAERNQNWMNVTALDKPECKKCAKALQELENIDDEADQLDIGFVKIHDEALADEYNLGNLPTLVYYRHQIPIIYEGYIFVPLFLFFLLHSPQTPTFFV